MLKKIIIVDNDKDSRKIIREIFSGSYQIIEAHNGHMAVEMMFFDPEDIAAMFVDVSNADIDGFEVLEARCESPDLTNIPVIITTVSDDKKTKSRAMLMGANDLIVKPYKPEIVKKKFADIIQRNEESSSLNLLLYDKLTQIFKRESFFEIASKIMSDHEPGHYMISCLDINSFKVINDQYGTEMGDKVLQHVADCLKDYVIQIGGICSRVAADDFAVLYPKKNAQLDEIKQLHQHIMSADCIGKTIHIRIGRYVVNDISLPVSVMLDRAVMAAESIKGMYDKYIAEYDDSMRANLIHEQHIVNDMNDALSSGEFEPWLQPQYNHATGAMIGAEALVRWKKNGKYISPGEFIPVFERNGFIYEMDQYIWEQTCIIMRRWIDEGRSPLPVSVNISRCDVFHKDFISNLTGIVNKYDLPYDLIRLEVTESAFSESTDIIVSRVVELINLGFTVEIDDFGSGFSSLNTLKDVPASILKLDMKFFENKTNSQRSGNIIESIVRMAKWLGMAVIAEGVEELEQADYLKSIGCYYIQGYFYSKPIPVCDYENLLDKCNKEPELSLLKTLQTLDNNEFWNPKSMETLIFNSYVGGACIFEYNNRNVELLRVNEQYANELGYFREENLLSSEHDMLLRLNKENRQKFFDNINKAVILKKQSVCELVLSDEKHIEYIRVTIREIARAGERYLFYCVLVNMTEQRNAEKREMENAQQLQVIMGNLNGGVSAKIINDDGSSETVFNNEKYYSIYGYTKEQAIEENLDIMSIIMPEDLENVMTKVRKLKQDRIPVIIDYRCIKRDGRIAYLRANSSLMYMDGYGDVITSVITDITEQREISDQLRAVIDNIDGGVSATVIRDGVPEFIIVNNRFFNMLGYESQQECESECTDKYSFIHPDDRAEVIRKFTSSDTEKKQYTLEYRIIRKDGIVRYIRNNIRVINILGVDEPVQLSVSNDITEQREAEQKEMHALDKLRKVLNNAGNGITAIAMYDDRIELVFANSRYYELIGSNENEKMTYAQLISVIHPEDCDYVSSELTEFRNTGCNKTIEFRVVHPDGEIRWLKTVITVTSLSNIDAPVQISVFSDITDEKESSEQLRFLNDSAHDLLAQPDSEKAVNDTLKKLVEYFSADRAYVTEFDSVHKFCNNTYEYCADGVKRGIHKVKDLPYNDNDAWLVTLKTNEYVVINSVKEMGDEVAQLREILINQGITSFITAQLLRNGEIIGYVGVDNPSNSLNHFNRIKALGDYITILITRRDLDRKIKSDSETMHLLINDTPGGFCRIRIIDNMSNQKIEHVNKGFCQMLGMSENEIMSAGSDIHKLFCEDDIADLLADSAEALRTGGQFITKCRLKRKDQIYMSIMIFGRFVRDDKNQLYLNAFFTDITDQIAAEEQQKQLIDNLPCGASLSVFDGKHMTIIHINKKYWQLVGREPENNIDISALSMVHPNDRTVAYQELEAAIRQKRNVSCDVRIRYGESDYHPFHVASTIVPQIDGKYVFYSSYTPISEKTMSIQEMLPVALSTMMSASEDVSFVKDKDLRYICCSKSAALQLGFENEREVIGKTDRDFFDIELAKIFENDDINTIQTGKSTIDNVIRIPLKKGGFSFINISKYPLMDSQGNVIGVYGTSRDVTRQKENESQLELLTSSIPGGLGAFSINKNQIKTIYCNEGFYKYTGYERDEYLKMTANDPFALMFDDDRARIRHQNHCGREPHDGQVGYCEYRCHTKDGGYRWMNLKSKISKISDDQFIINVVQFDITEQKEKEEELRIAEEEYRIAAHQSGLAIGRYNISNQTLKISTDAAQMLSTSEFIQDVPYGRVKSGKISDDTSEAYIEFFENIIHGKKEDKVTFEKHMESGLRLISAHETTIFSDDGKPVSAVISFADITDQNKKEEIYMKWQQSLSDRNSESYSLFRCNLSKDASFESREGTLINHDDFTEKDTFDESTLKYANHCVYSEERSEYISLIKADKLIANFYRGRRNFSIDYREIIAADSVRWLRLSVELIEQPNSENIMAYLMFENIDQIKREELMTIKRSETDSLTGVLNRSAFELKVNRIIRNSKSDQNHVMMMLDVDHFKQVNDILGHEAGDQALIDVTKQIRSALRHCDLIGRLGGDEFLMFFTDIPDRGICAKIAQRVCDLTRRTLDHDVNISVSIGISAYSEDGDNFETLYKKADKALYYIKENGKNNYAFYDNIMTADK